MHLRIHLSCALLALLLAGRSSASDSTAAFGHTGSTAKPSPMRERDVVDTPVPTVQPERMSFMAGNMPVEIPIALTRDWTRPQTDVTRAIIVIHGWPRRDLRSGERAQKAAGKDADGTIVITPQFLTSKDIAAHHLPIDMLRWKETGWQKGASSDDAAAISSFAVVDKIFGRLSDHRIFPNLKTIVLAGHSAGGQFVQRYAAVGQGETYFADGPVHVRYVVANPSSFLYFTNDRPDGRGGFSPFSAAVCKGFDRWPYGVQGGAPASLSSYIPSLDTIKDRYLARDVVYLLGGADNDSHADGLDRSCSAEAEGPTRLARGLAYNAYVHMLDPSTKQYVLTAYGVAHHSVPMYTSTCGLSALFDKAGCD